MDIPQSILIVGLGATGLSVARYLGGLGKQITITDRKREEELAAQLPALNGITFTARFGEHCREDFLRHDLIVVSPGVDTEAPLFKEAMAHGVPVVGEIEFASAFVDEPIIAVTGTNGKTTCTSLLGEVFRAAFGEVFVGGNIGRPLMEYVRAGKRLPYVILEISSFQLETAETFHPRTALLLNITEDHLDRYRSFDDYVRAKLRIFENQSEGDHAILNRNMAVPVTGRGRRIFFSSGGELEEGAFVRSGSLVVRLDGQEYVYKRSLSPLVGVHNTENILSVLLVAHLYGIAQQVIEEALAAFRGLPHRIEFVRELKGVTFYNDSKATNVDATRRALEGFDKPLVLIAGGKDKGGSYRSIAAFRGKVKAIVVLGAAGARIAEELGGDFAIFNEETLGGAVERAFGLAGPGETVLFSPMCSSFDMFLDYKDRGNKFREAVEAL